MHTGGPFTLSGGFWNTTTAPIVSPPVPPVPPGPPGPPVAPVAPVVAIASQPDDDQDDDAERARELREARNRPSRDDVATEGNVLEVRCDAEWPSVVIANRDGAVEVRLTKDAVSACRSIQVGDYLEVDGEKQHEQLYDATDVTITRNGDRVR